MKKFLTVLSGGLATTIAAALIVFLLSSAIKAAIAPTWEAVKTEVSFGKSVRLEVRLNGGNAAPGTITVTSSRIDMGPDGMPTMSAPLRQVQSTTPGVLAFEADLPMAGRWALTLTTQSRRASRAREWGGRLHRSGEAVGGGASSQLLPRTAHCLLPQSHGPAGQSLRCRRRIRWGWTTSPSIPTRSQGRPAQLKSRLRRCRRLACEPSLSSGATFREQSARSARSCPTKAVWPWSQSSSAALSRNFSSPRRGVEVRAGQPIARVWIESTEILQKQADFLTALRGGASRGGDIESTERNLRLFGIPSSSHRSIAADRRTGPIRGLERSGKGHGLGKARHGGYALQCGRYAVPDGGSLDRMGHGPGLRAGSGPRPPGPNGHHQPQSLSQ